MFGLLQNDTLRSFILARSDDKLSLQIGHNDFSNILVILCQNKTYIFVQL